MDQEGFRSLDTLPRFKPGTSTNAKKVLSEFRQDSTAKNYNSTPNTVIKDKSKGYIEIPSVSQLFLTEYIVLGK